MANPIFRHWNRRNGTIYIGQQYGCTTANDTQKPVLRIPKHFIDRYWKRKKGLKITTQLQKNKSKKKRNKKKKSGAYLSAKNNLQERPGAEGSLNTAGADGDLSGIFSQNSSRA